MSAKTIEFETHAGLRGRVYGATCVDDVLTACKKLIEAAVQAQPHIWPESMVPSAADPETEAEQSAPLKFKSIMPFGRFMAALGKDGFVYELQIRGVGQNAESRWHRLGRAEGEWVGVAE